MKQVQSDIALTLIENSIVNLDENTQDAMKRVSWYLINTKFGQTNILRRTSKAFKISQKKLDLIIREVFGDDIWIKRNNKLNKQFYRSLYKQYY